MMARARAAPGRITGMLALAAVVTACSSAPARESPVREAARNLVLEGRMRLRIEVPPHYELNTDRTALFDLYELWRVPVRPLREHTALSIVVGKAHTAYCRPGEGETHPAAFRHWSVQWHVCGEEGTRARTWETHLPGATSVPVHVFVIGPDAAESRRLRAIAETLEPLGEPTAN